MEQGKGPVLNYFELAFFLAEEPGDREILVVVTLFIYDSSFIAANESGTIGRAANGTAIQRIAIKIVLNYI